MLKGHNTKNSGHTGQNFKTKLMSEIYSQSQFRAIGKVLLMKSSKTPFKTHEGDENWPLFVNKQLFFWSASITLDNNNEVLTDF